MAITGVRQGDMVSGSNAVSITVNTADRDRAKGIYIGTSQGLDLSFDGTNWVAFQGMVAGVIYPLQAVGARKTAGSAAPDAGDVVFLY